MISNHKTLWLVVLTAMFVIMVAGCNDTLRQFITPLPSPGGDPAALSHAIVLSTNPAGNGSDLHINVSGDTVAGVTNVGPDPVFLGRTSNRAFVLNQGNNTVSSYIALLPFSSVTTVTLPPGTTATGGGFSSIGNFYLTNPAAGNVQMININVLAVTESVPVGANPVAIAGNSGTNKIYVVNHGSGTVTAISAADNTVLAQIAVGVPVGTTTPDTNTNPIWGVMAPDGVHAFIVNQGNAAKQGSVSVIDTLLDKEIADIPVGKTANPLPNYAVFEPTLQRVYVSNTGENTITVIKANGIDLANGIVPTKVKDIDVSGAPTSVAALTDGTRVYAALGGCAAGTDHTNILTNLPGCTGNLVSVIDVVSLTEKKTITVGAGAVSIDAASDSSRVYVVGAADRNVSIIRTATDSVVATIPAPQQSLGCTNPASCPANVAQIPFLVRVFP